MNTLDGNGKKHEEPAEEERGKIEFEETTQPVDHTPGHLQEIEVDISHVLQDKEIRDIGEDTSPYPEVVRPSVERSYMLRLLQWTYAGSSELLYRKRTILTCL